MLSLQQNEPFKKFYKQNSGSFSWHLTSWENFIALQQPIYADKKQLENCLALLKKTPALIPPRQIEQLKKHIALASRGQEFLLQAGDCAEQFKDCSRSVVTNKVNSILFLKKILEQGLKKAVIPIGRIAGQYAKPRSYENEIQHSLTLPSFKGDIIHSSEFSFEARKANPQRMLTAYNKTAETLNYIHNLENVSLFYTSHEALLLCYESAMTRSTGNENDFYNASAHFLWVGERTRHLNGAHIEYLRGISNPIGIKLSHQVTNEELIELILTLNPKHEEGKIILVHRLGADSVDFHLPRLIRAVKAANLQVAWMCDPMHGNGEISLNGLKTRRFENICSELLRSVQIHKTYGTFLAGVHIETSEKDVTECLGGNQQISSYDLVKNYQSVCDPRLNPLQSAELTRYLVEEINSF